MRHLILFVSAWINCCVFIQAQGNLSDALPRTHALIVGISEYKHLGNLSFADDDALAFQAYVEENLQSKKDTNNIVVLINEEALSSNIYMALENLISQTKKDDKVYIYFSGHGDSENATLFKSGFFVNP